MPSRNPIPCPPGSAILAKALYGHRPRMCLVSINGGKVCATIMWHCNHIINYLRSISHEHTINLPHHGLHAGRHRHVRHLGTGIAGTARAELRQHSCQESIRLQGDALRQSALQSQLLHRWSQYRPVYHAQPEQPDQGSL